MTKQYAFREHNAEDLTGRGKNRYGSGERANQDFIKKESVKFDCKVGDVVKHNGTSYKLVERGEFPIGVRGYWASEIKTK